VCVCVVVTRQLANRYTGCRSRGKTVTEDCGGGVRPATSVGIIYCCYILVLVLGGETAGSQQVYIYILPAATTLLYTA